MVSLEYLDAKYFKRDIILQSQNLMFTYSIFYVLTSSLTPPKENHCSLNIWHARFKKHKQKICPISTVFKRVINLITIEIKEIFKRGS